MICQRLVRKAGSNAVRATAGSSASSLSRIPNSRGGSAFSIRTLSSSSALSVPAWATADPITMGVDVHPHAVQNLVGGIWAPVGSTAGTITIPHPLDVQAPPIFTIPDTQISELGPFFESLRKVSKSGLHNPLKHPERYVQYGEISRKVRTTNVRRRRMFTERSCVLLLDRDKMKIRFDATGFHVVIKHCVTSF